MAAVEEGGVDLRDPRRELSSATGEQGRPADHVSARKGSPDPIVSEAPVCTPLVDEPRGIRRSFEICVARNLEMMSACILVKPSEKERHLLLVAAVFSDLQQGAKNTVPNVERRARTASSAQASDTIPAGRIAKSPPPRLDRFRSRVHGLSLDRKNVTARAMSDSACTVPFRARTRHERVSSSPS